jgi:hypothetical protein
MNYAPRNNIWGGTSEIQPGSSPGHWGKRRINRPAAFHLFFARADRWLPSGNWSLGSTSRSWGTRYGLVMSPRGVYCG